ncbi:MAG: hypothetical protein ACKVW3_08295 [Phycisphaerales bacterium]
MVLFIASVSVAGGALVPARVGHTFVGIWPTGKALGLHFSMILRHVGNWVRDVGKFTREVRDDSRTRA